MREGEPVVMAPLRREWDETRELVVNLLTTGKKQPTGGEKELSKPQRQKARAEADGVVRNFLDRLAGVKVLDPACGSGNFLYVTLQKLLDLEREAGSFAEVHGIGGHFPRVDPRQLHGIEINPYAFELAQMTVWIGYLQWMSRHGSPWPADPVLKPLTTFECKDAILDLSNPAHPQEPSWPAADYIVSNPPFLGGKLLRTSLGDSYVDSLFRAWDDRVPREADLCCYWFEKARAHVEAKRCDRAGLLATQGIRGGANRKILDRIKQTGDIFFAESDRPWIIAGANVHVSMVGFDNGSEAARTLDGQDAPTINTNLTSAVDITRARRLTENLGLCFMGDTKVGAFEIAEATALTMLSATNPHGKPTSDVLRPWANGLDLTRRPQSKWIVDFPPGASEREAALYEVAFEHLQQNVRPFRATARSGDRTGVAWWIHQRPRPEMRGAIAQCERFVATPSVAKHRLFGWLQGATLPDHQLLVFSRSDDYFFGVLHSRVHEVWALRLGTRLETRPRYTPTTCFETFPFPWPPGHEPASSNHEPRTTNHVSAIAAAASSLDTLRTAWLNPPEWTRTETLEFPGSTNGPWARFVHDPDERGIGTVRWPRLVPRDAECAAKLKARTLTNLYNQRPAWLALAHATLDAAVFAAYGWDPTMTDEQLLEALLTLNLERAGSS